MSDAARPEDAADEPVVSLHETVDFAHNSERQFAKLLDFYGVDWRYEPDTFVLERDAAGLPVKAFSPDFYLPAHDLYLEITTLKQKLVTKKNRKVRRLQELYPHVNVKVLYQRDYLNLLVKYGLESPEQLEGYDGGTAAAETTESLLLLGPLAAEPPADPIT